MYCMCASPWEHHKNEFLKCFCSTQLPFYYVQMHIAQFETWYKLRLIFKVQIILLCMLYKLYNTLYIFFVFAYYVSICTMWWQTKSLYQSWGFWVSATIMVFIRCDVYLMLPHVITAYVQKYICTLLWECNALWSFTGYNSDRIYKVIWIIL